MKAEMVKMQTSHPKISTKSGFTLLEILIVMAILGVLVAFGLPKFKNPKDNIKAVVAKMSTLTREIRHQARIKRRTYRLVLKMNGGNSSVKDSYWVESAEANTLIPSKETLESLKKKSEEEKPPAAFQKAENLVKGERELPSGLFIGSVETTSSDQAAVEGEAYVYFTQEGLVEKSMIQITNRDKLTWTLIINPLTGHVDVVEKAMRLKDLQID